MSATVWIPIGAIYFYVRFITIPGLALLCLIKLNSYFHWNGLFGSLETNSYAINLLQWYVIFDLGHYISHYLMHQNQYLWKFHKMHHAATEMNIITGSRTSFAERAFSQFVNFGLLTIMFGLPSLQTAILLVLIRKIIEMLQHSDLPWDYGIIGYVIAGPRFHKMHHSDDPQDYNGNYGNLFTFWDTIFKTWSPRYKSEGPAIVDEITTGLATEEENVRYNSWYFALYDQTIFFYIVKYFKLVLSLETPTIFKKSSNLFNTIRLFFIVK